MGTVIENATSISETLVSTSSISITRKVSTRAPPSALERLSSLKLRKIIKENHGQQVSIIQFDKLNSGHENHLLTIGGKFLHTYDNANFKTNLDVQARFHNLSNEYTSAGSGMIKSARWLKAVDENPNFTNQSLIVFVDDRNNIGVIDIAKTRVIALLHLDAELSFLAVDEENGGKFWVVLKKNECKQFELNNEMDLKEIPAKRDPEMEEITTISSSKGCCFVCYGSGKVMKMKSNGKSELVIDESSLQNSIQIEVSRENLYALTSEGDFIIAKLSTKEIEYQHNISKGITCFCLYSLFDNKIAVAFGTSSGTIILYSKTDDFNKLQSNLSTGGRSIGSMTFSDATGTLNLLVGAANCLLRFDENPQSFK